MRIFAHTQLAKESQQENVKLTLAGLPRREIEDELTCHERVAAFLREIETEIVYEKQRKDFAPPVIAANIFSGKTMYFLAEVPLAVTSEAPPERPGEPDCPYFIKTQKSKFDPRCKFNHSKERTLGVAENADPSQLPQRSSEPPCVFYTKTGNCKFGASCKFHHPKDIVIPLSGQVNGTGNEAFKNASVMPVQPIAAPASLHNSKGLPVRPGEVDCPFYLKTGSCKYGANCRHNHPDIYATHQPAGAAAFATTSTAHLNSGVVNPAASMIKSIDPRLNQSMLGLGPAIYPQRPGQIECDFYMKSGECKFGERCKFHHPINRFAHTQLAKESQQENVKLTLAGLPRREIEGELTYHERVAAFLREIETEIVYEKQRKDFAPHVIAAIIFSGKTMYFLAEVPLAVISEAPTERPGEPDCPYFIKTQKSKFGPRCKFNHPKERTLGVAENADPSQLPQRTSEPPCIFYTKTGNCKFGASCKFHHPNDIVIPLSGQVNGTGNEEAFKNGSVMPVQPIAAPASLHNSKDLRVRPL